MAGHKKGEDVLNNFPKTLERARAALQSAVKGADPGFSFASHCPRAERILNGFGSDPRVNAARSELRAAATGELSDANSQAYGAAAERFQAGMRDVGAHVAAAIRRLEARDEAGANRAMNQAAAAKNRAYAAWRDMVANGFDHRAAQCLLGEPLVHEATLKRRAKLIQDLTAAMQYFGVRGMEFCESVLDELGAYVMTSVVRRLLSRRSS